MRQQRPNDVLGVLDDCQLQWRDGLLQPLTRVLNEAKLAQDWQKGANQEREVRVGDVLVSEKVLDDPGLAVDDGEYEVEPPAVEGRAEDAFAVPREASTAVAQEADTLLVVALDGQLKRGN